MKLVPYILKAAFRDRFLLSSIGLMVCVYSLSLFFGAASIVEKEQFLVSFVSYGLRLFGVISLTLFTVNFIRKCFDARDVEYLLSRPISRESFILSYAIGVTLLSIALAGIFFLPVFFLADAVPLMNKVTWIVSLAVEFSIISNMALFFALILTSPTFCSVAVFAFYVLCRLIGEILGIISSYNYDGLMGGIETVMKFISIFVPRLDMFAQTRWILYPDIPDVSVSFVLIQGLLFVSLTLVSSMIDMRRRQF